MASESCFSELSLSGHELLHTSNMRELGLNVSTDKNVPKSSSLLAKHGYFFRPENERLCAIAYRIQDVKYDYPPKFLQRITYYKCLSGFFSRIIQVSRDPPWVPIMLPKDALPGVLVWKIVKNPKSGPLHPTQTPELLKSRNV